MNAEIKNGQLIITIPVNDVKALPETSTRLSYALGTTGGNQAISMSINGKPTVVKIGANAFIPIPGRKKLKDGSVVDHTGKVLVNADGTWAD